MNKVAFFLEGLTEQIFTEKLLIEIAGNANISIKKRKLTGGNKIRRTGLCFRNEKNDKECFAYLIDCSGDSSVKSDIVDHYDSLVKNGYKAIIGIKDLYPGDRGDLNLHRSGLLYGVKTKPVLPVFVVPVMEIEAWFLAEHTHFERIHPNLSIDSIKTELQFDPSMDDVELRNYPTQDLDDIYSLEGLEYPKVKKEHQIRRTIDALDFDEIYLNLGSKLDSIRELVSEIERFLNLPHD